MNYCHSRQHHKSKLTSLFKFHYLIFLPYHRSARLSRIFLISCSSSLERCCCAAAFGVAAQARSPIPFHLSCTFAEPPQPSFPGAFEAAAFSTASLSHEPASFVLLSRYSVRRFLLSVDCREEACSLLSPLPVSLFLNPYLVLTSACLHLDFLFGI